MGLALALSAGMVTAFNPCGVALLPAFLSVLLTVDASERRLWWRGARAGVAMTAGFVLIFGLAGLVVTSLGRILYVLAPLTSTVVAVILLAGAWRFWRGGAIPGVAALGSRTAQWVQAARPGALLLYGISYGLVSLTCSLPVFLAVAVTGFHQSVGVGLMRYGVYALGMGLIVTGLAVLTVTARKMADAAVAAVAPLIPKLSAVVMALGSLYLFWYWFIGPGQHTGLI